MIQLRELKRNHHDIVNIRSKYFILFFSIFYILLNTTEEKAFFTYKDLTLRNL